MSHELNMDQILIKNSLTIELTIHNIMVPLERFELPIYCLQGSCTSQLCYKGIKFFQKWLRTWPLKDAISQTLESCCSHLVFLQVDITITTFVKSSKLLLIVIIDFISSHTPLERFSTSLHLVIWIPGLRLCSYFLTFHLASSARQHIAVE